MNNLPTISQEELVERVRAGLQSKPFRSGYSEFSAAPPSTPPAAFALVLGAGFSFGVVPLVDELMRRTIGAYYYPHLDGSSGDRLKDAPHSDSAAFWTDFNHAASRNGLPVVALDAAGLPKDCAAAYQRLFTYREANELFRPEQRRRKLSFVEQLGRRRARNRGLRDHPEERENTGEAFVKGFLRYVLDPGSEHGYGSSGRNDLNPAHIYLAALLEAQQLGLTWKTAAFCRTIFTTNFDTMLQNGLQMVNLLYRITDRPERGFEPTDFHLEESPIHLVYTHGSILRHNPASTAEELSALEKRNADVLHKYLQARDVIAIGYSGWRDSLMEALRRCRSNRQALYWCDVKPEPASHVSAVLRAHTGSAAYVRLDRRGADGLMRALYEALIPQQFQRDPLQRYRMWRQFVWGR